MLSTKHKFSAIKFDGIYCLSCRLFATTVSLSCSLAFIARLSGLFTVYCYCYYIMRNMSYSLLYKLPDSPLPISIPILIPFAMPSIHCPYSTSFFFIALCIPSFFVIASRLATVCTDLLNIIHIVDGQWFLLANKKLNVGLVCWLDLVTCSCSVSPSSAASSCFHSHSHSSCSPRLVSSLVLLSSFIMITVCRLRGLLCVLEVIYVTWQCNSQQGGRDGREESGLWIAVSTGRITRH